MTVAVCIRCGAMKHGALTPCSECSFDPKGNEDKAKAMVLTDHLLPLEELRKVSERIRTGRPVRYPEDVVKQYIESFEASPTAGRFRAPWRVGVLAVIVLAVAVLLWLIVRNT